MESGFKINRNDLEQLGYERKILLNVNNLIDGMRQDKQKVKIGQTNYKQEYFPGFSIMEWDSLFHEDIKINGYTTKPIFAIHFMMEGSTEYAISNDKTIISGEKNNLWSLNAGYIGYCKFKKNIYCSSLGVIIHDKFLYELTNKYPDLLSEVYKKHLKGETFYLSKDHLVTSSEMNQIIDQIRNAKLMGRVHKIYSEAKIIELIALQLQQHVCSSCQIKQHCNRQYDIDKIHEAKRILLTDLDNPPSIQELSRKVGINEKKLKYGFKEIFNQTVYGSLFDHKMTLARKLLLDTDKTIVEVANECGYDYASHFTTAFKRKYGVSPKKYKNIC